MPVGLPLVIAVLTVAGILFRPFRWPEYAFALIGACTVVLSGAIGPVQAAHAVLAGGDVYLFLVGMMLLSEAARQSGLFDWLAIRAVQAARGSGQRLFTIVFAVGALVTTFMSNDATAVVLTPAVFAAARAAGRGPLPYLFACALIANAASFVLPISNPANLVVFNGAVPSLFPWLGQFLLPSLAAIAATYVALRLIFRRAISGHSLTAIAAAPLLPGGRIAGVGVIGAAVAMSLASATGAPLGGVTLACGVAVIIMVARVMGRPSAAFASHISWGVLPLVAGLFVVVAAVFATSGALAAAHSVGEFAQSWPTFGPLVVGGTVGLASNVINNLPVGLMVATAAHTASLSLPTVSAMLIGVDLGPNLSLTGSLATILWLVALRREGVSIGAAQFFRVGLIAMPPALILALIVLAASI